MDKEKLKELFDKHLKLALEIKPEDVRFIEEGMSEQTARKYREFSELTEEEQIQMINNGEI